VTAQARWQPLLYGRTARADRWWRLRPYDVTMDWLNAAVVACTGGGDGLAAHPRFLLARSGPLLLVGAACRASALSDTMNSDGSRPFYTFTGWITRDAQTRPPDWDTFTAGWRRWATEVYDSWMPLDWNKHRTDLGDGHEAPYIQAPWAAEASEAPRSPTASAGQPAPPTREGTIIVPAEAAPMTWAALAVAAFDFAFVAGFDRPPANVRGTLTHASVASAEIVTVQPATQVQSETIPVRETRDPMPPPGRDDGASFGSSWDQRQHDEAAPARHREPRAGWRNRAVSWILGGEEEDGPSDEPPAPERDAEEEPRYGPMKDLDYWTQRDKPARPRPGESRKHRPPDE
jgi:hypothetical protein